MDAIFKRRSVRKFQDIPVGEEKMEQILRAAMAAPSGGGQNPWEFYVVTDRRTLELLSGTSRYAVFTKDAPAAIVPCFRTENLIYPELTALDMSMAAENIMVEAAELDLGSVFLAVYPYEDRMQHVEKVLKIPEGLHAFSIILLGSPFQSRVRPERFEPSRIHKI